ncbi:NAD-dependent succinate-semialdehyde dehydrogenase [Prosthecochloris sp. N3]|uniref:NAD-dependent succinate-semialdehyde dehydrogenase n=1 Tax=Prosthecochloris ethylica TaxID=2743976 RepID=A0ABR9XNH3_9CHLB|nr:NAD-dependent succinate-semialdehyde dehydrogenase [Prosthecochloris ethylica]MBF0585682.1 NAD-dependent succinate-semialdehyde dehydrogenase [Prosthecochloris ethylica]MBF0635592.1 NAD-dependent succinate-semialdehyde dehydrogenase [Prosthecochloris ethylica]NUK46891.1 NAD-dependent succinate-semialdehyde dehydrogenase [Prosthecochloris ethylica]
MIRTINPSNGELLAEYPAMTAADIEHVLLKTGDAASRWKQCSVGERAGFMNRLAGLLREQNSTHAEMISREMGKPLSQAVAEVEKCAWVCEYYAEHAESFLQPETVDVDGLTGLVTFEPLGVVLGVMPWNFPFWQVFRFASAVMMAGNGIVVKHAPNVTGSAIAIEQLFREAGFPEHLYRTLHIDLEDVNELVGAVIDHPVVKAVSVTGSTGAGIAVASKAGRALKPSVLELGGNDPYIVLEDADLRQAASVCIAARLLNAGQSCIAAKRFLVHASVKKEFEDILVADFSARRMGDPFDPDVTVGPIARRDLRDELHKQVEISRNMGATVLCGGEVPPEKGFFYPPTVVTDVRPGMPVYSEETFGPVATVIGFSDDDEAVSIANDSPYGLGSAVFSADTERARSIAARLEAGNCFINAMVKSDPRLPFGGVKQSGYGRELSSYGLREFVNVKTVYTG